MCHVLKKIVLENHTLFSAAILALCPVLVLYLFFSRAFVMVRPKRVIHHTCIDIHDYPA
jgi:hypothetical protein